MKTTMRTLSALVAGVFLNLGLDRSAEWLDPVSQASESTWQSEVQIAAACTSCIEPDAHTDVC